MKYHFEINYFRDQFTNRAGFIIHWLAQDAYKYPLNFDDKSTHLKRDFDRI